MTRTWIVLVIWTFLETSLSLKFVPEPAEKQLQDSLLNIRSWKVRPVVNFTDQLMLNVRFRLTRITDLDLRDQLLTMNVKIFQEWTDYKLTWNPEDFGGVEQINLPSSQIWLPDFELYNSFGVFEMKGEFVQIHHTGKITWDPSAAIVVFCPIQVKHYPFDIQSCLVEFGSWTYDGNLLYIKLIDVPGNGTGSVPIGMDLSSYYPSSEWELISIPGENLERYYPCCVEPYVAIQFNVTLRRHSRFYLVHLLMPLTGLSYLSVLVFYLPADSNEKITLCVSVLTSQVMFLLLMMGNIPITSLAVPLLGKIIVFHMTLVFFSVLCTTIVMNVYYRKPTTHNMPNWVRLVRFSFLPKVLLIEAFPMEIYKRNDKHHGYFGGSDNDAKSRLNQVSRLCSLSLQEIENTNEPNTSFGSRQQGYQKAINNVYFVRNYMARLELINHVCEEWKFLAAILDRIFLILFNLAFVVGTCSFMMDAPALYDQRKAIGQGQEVEKPRDDDMRYIVQENDNITTEGFGLVFVE